MTKVIAIRPEPGLSATLEAGRELGLDIDGAPLFEIRPLEWHVFGASRFDALLLGSANAIRHGGINLEQFRGKPAYVVGKATEKAASDFGIAIASTGTGGLQSVLDAVSPPASLLRIAGAEHVALTPPEGVTIETVIAYESVALSLDRALLGDGEERTIVLFHSAVAAEHFAQECDRIGMDRTTIEIAALGPRIASSAGKGWAAIHVSERPNDADLLALVRGLCT